MRSVNKAILLGNIGRDPETRNTQGGTLVANMSIACAERRKDGSGNWTDHVEWINLVAFGRTAEIVQQYVKKGSRILVIGRIQTNSWDDKKSGEKKYRTQVAVDELVMLDSRDSNGGGQQSSSRDNQSYDEITDEDIPF